MYESAPRIAWFTAADGYRLAARVYDASAQPAARVIFLHGIISHGGWYLAGCRHMAAAGIETHFLDRRGSGLNTSQRGDVDHYRTWLGDVEGYLDHLPVGPPTFLLGISWGGKLAAAVARHYRGPLAGLGLLCPGLYARQGAGPLARFGLRIAQRLGLGRLRVTIPLDDPTLFTADAQWQTYVSGDPLALRQVTIRFALADLDLTRYAREAQEIRMPTLLVLAGRDRIIDNARVRAFAGKWSRPTGRLSNIRKRRTRSISSPTPRGSTRTWPAGCAGPRSQRSIGRTQPFCGFDLPWIVWPPDMPFFQLREELYPIPVVLCERVRGTRSHCSTTTLSQPAADLKAKNWATLAASGGLLANQNPCSFAAYGI